MADGVTANAFPSRPVDHQLCAFLELFLDIMYADVVLNDRCCRRVGETLVAEQESTLRMLVGAAAHVMPDGLRQSVSTYCVRHVLLRSPELMLTSTSVTQALLKLAENLAQAGVRAEKGEGSLASMGQTIREEVSALSHKLETKRYAHLIDTLGDAVIGYMSLGAEDMRVAAAKELEDGKRLLPSPFIHRFLPTVARFAEAANKEREVRKQQRDAELNQSADRLLFEHAKPPPPHDAADTVPPQAETLSEEIQAAMATPARPADALGQRQYLAGGEPPAVARRTEDSHLQPRRLVAAEDSVLAGVEALQDSTNESPDLAEPSEIAVDRSDVGGVVDTLAAAHNKQEEQAHRRRMVVGASEASVLAMAEDGLADQGEEGEGEGRELSPAQAYVLGSKEAVPRSYFLCSATNRYEPVAARGFFSQ